jgi:murein DD-endopeptidase MepM/ murein hydrolase activator NlpD
LLAVVSGTDLASAQQAEAQAADVVLTTIPRHVYKVVDRMDLKEKSECWYFHVVVRGKQTRSLDPMSAAIRLYSGATVHKELMLRADALNSQLGVTFKKHAGLDEVFDLRHHFCESQALSIDRILYELEVRASDGRTIRTSIDIPVRTYAQKVKLVFPVRGNFVVTNGNVVEGGHHEWSQHFAYDIIGLGPHLDILTGQGTKNHEFAGWGREVIAPAGGVVTYTRNDVPDNAAPGVIDMGRLQNLPEQPWPAAGNVVVIDHGTGEYSLLGHMQKGSVRVKRGDRVKQGEVLGLLGNSGHSQAPHLHYHLMDGEQLFRSDGLPSRFENIDGGTPTYGLTLEAK